MTKQDQIDIVNQVCEEMRAKILQTAQKESLSEFLKHAKPFANPKGNEINSQIWQSMIESATLSLASSRMQTGKSTQI